MLGSKYSQVCKIQIQKSENLRVEADGDKLKVKK